MYYYYGVHKEKNINEYYVGTPVTHKWCWELYEPKKQILQFFEFNDAGWLEAQEVEKRLIKSFYNIDKWCLNENCGGLVSLNQLKSAGEKSGLSHKQNGTGFFKLTKKERSELSKKYGRIGGNKTKELGVGIHGLSEEERSNNSKKSVKNTNSQRWECTVTGFVTNSGALTSYQKKRNIDISKRRRIS